MNLRPRSPIAIVCALSSILLTGCNSTSFGSDTISLANYYFSSSGAHRITYEQAAAIPYASMGFSIGDGPEFLVVLATEGGGPQLWTSSSRVALLTQKGRIVRTAGLGHDLAGLQLQSSPHDDASSEEISFTVDLSDIGIYNLVVRCHRKSEDPEVIQILGRSIHTKRINEDCSTKGGAITWSFRNTFWVDARTGFVWKSSQHVHPDLDAVDTETLRPPTN